MYLSQILCWHRYIDHVLVVWAGDVLSLQQLMNILNDNSYNLKFTFSFNARQVSFLDLLIRKDDEGRIDTTLFHKETAGNTILRSDSAHSVSLVRSIPYGQYLRLRRNCSNDLEFWKEAGLLPEILRKRGYSNRLLNCALKKGRGKDRQTSIQE